MDADDEFDGPCQSMTVTLGDCQLWAECKCGTNLGYILPSGSLDKLAQVWERHSMLGTPGEKLKTIYPVT